MTKQFNQSVHFSSTEKGSGQVGKLIEVGLTLAGPTGAVKWEAIQAALPKLEIGYGRGWCIVRRAWLEANAANLLLDLTIDRIHAAEFKAKGSEFDPMVHVYGPIVTDLRSKGLSWGEIAVRCNIPESKVRKAFNQKAGQHDLGQRIGKGGRFALGRGDLYTDNMKAEGFHAAATMKRAEIRTADQSAMLNYRPKDGVAKKAARRPRKAS